MQGTRERILARIIQRRSVRVEELAEAFDISTVAVRRHLDHLRADGLVDVSAVKQATGRPHYEFHPTELAFGSLPDGYARLLAGLLPALDAHEGMAATLSQEMAQSVAARHSGEMSPGTPAETVAQVTASLRTEGILDTWEESDDGYHLVNGTCPYLQAAELSRLPCESDRQAISLLMGSEVEQIARIVDGAPVCEYLVRHGEDERASAHPAGETLVQHHN